MRQYDSMDQAFRNEVAHILSGGAEVAPRDLSTLEMEGSSFRLRNPRHRLIFSENRNWSLAYAIGEYLWHVSGSDDLAHIAFYSSFWHKCADAEGTIRGSCYGRRIFGENSHGESQWTRIKAVLADDPDSRRAVLVLAEPDVGLSPTNPDVACCSVLQFLVRDGRLNLVTYMRSNDAILGFGYDVFLFTMLQEGLAIELRIPMGWYQHITGSMHVYQNDLELARLVVDEPLQTGEPMPSMDHLDQLPEVIRAERMIRTGEVDNADVFRDFSPYWQRVLTVLLCHALLKHGDPGASSKAAASLCGSPFERFVAVASWRALGRRLGSRKRPNKQYRRLLDCDDKDVLFRRVASCKFCGREECRHERCPRCGYSYCDCVVHGDHRLCGLPDPPKPNDVSEPNWGVPPSHRMGGKRPKKSERAR